MKGSRYGDCPCTAACLVNQLGAKRLNLAVEVTAEQKTSGQGGDVARVELGKEAEAREPSRQGVSRLVESKMGTVSSPGAVASSRFVSSIARQVGAAPLRNR